MNNRDNDQDNNRETDRDATARTARAKRIHELVEGYKKSPAGGSSTQAPQSPRDFIEEKTHRPPPPRKSSSET